MFDGVMSDVYDHLTFFVGSECCLAGVAPWVFGSAFEVFGMHGFERSDCASKGCSEETPCSISAFFTSHQV